MSEWTTWFNALDEGKKEQVRSAVAGETTSLDLSGGKFTHIPHRLFTDCQALTTLNLSFCSSLAALPKSIGQLQALMRLDLYGCSSLAALPKSIGQLQALTTLDLNGCTSLAALPESIGQLQALTTLDLYKCSSLADESREQWNFLKKRNMRIFNDRALRFPITTHVFKATVLFGSMKASNGMTNAAPSAIWRLIADYSGVSYKAAFEKWVTEIERKIKEEEDDDDEF